MPEVRNLVRARYASCKADNEVVDLAEEEDSVEGDAPENLQVHAWIQNRSNSGMAQPQSLIEKPSKNISYQGTDVRIDTQLIGIEFVKFQIERTHTPNPQLYFMNTKTHRSHGSFMDAAGLRRGQGQMRGVLSYRPLSIAPNGEPGVYTFEFNPNDAFPYEEIKLAHDLLVANMPTLKNRLGYCPLWGAIGIYNREKARYDAAEFPVYFEDDLYANIGYLPLNQAESFGRLRVLEIDERPSVRDIVICKTLPNEMPRVAGVITGVRQTPLSHVNLRAIQDKFQTPSLPTHGKQFYRSPYR